MDLIIQCFTSKYAKFSGRARRKEFWLFYLCFGILILIGLTLDFSFGLLDLENNFSPIATIIYLATLVPFISISVRRLHDVDWRGWWLLLYIIPVVNIIGGIFIFVLTVLKGTTGENRFGPDPLDLGSGTAPKNISTSNVITDSSINDGSQDASSSETSESKLNST